MHDPRCMSSSFGDNSCTRWLEIGGRPRRPVFGKMKSLAKSRKWINDNHKQHPTYFSVFYCQCLIVVWSLNICSFYKVLSVDFLKFRALHRTILLCTIKLSFVGQPDKFPWSRLQLLTKGHKVLAISEISRTLRSILAIPSNMRSSARALILPLYQYSEATYLAPQWLLPKLLQQPVSPPFSHSAHRYYLTLEILIFKNISFSFQLTLQSSGTATSIILQTLSVKKWKIYRRLYDWGYGVPSHTNVCKFVKFQLTFSHLI